METIITTTLQNSEYSEPKPVKRRDTGFEQIVSNKNEKLQKHNLFTLLPTLHGGIKGRKSILTNRDFMKSYLKTKNSVSPDHKSARIVYMTPPPKNNFSKRSIGIQTLFEQIFQGNLENIKEKSLLCQKIMFENESQENFGMDPLANDKMMKNVLKCVRDGTISKYEDFFPFMTRQKQLYAIEERSKEENTFENHFVNDRNKVYNSALDVDRNTIKDSRILVKFSEYPSVSKVKNPDTFNHSEKLFKKNRLKPKNSNKKLPSILSLTEENKKKTSENPPENQTVPLFENLSKEINRISSESNNIENEEEKYNQNGYNDIESLTEIEEVQESVIINTPNGNELIEDLIEKERNEDNYYESYKGEGLEYYQYDNSVKNKESPLKILMNKEVEEIAEISEDLEENSEYEETSNKSKNSDSLASDSSFSYNKSKNDEKSYSLYSEKQKSPENSKMSQKHKKKIIRNSNPESSDHELETSIAQNSINDPNISSSNQTSANKSEYDEPKNPNFNPSEPEEGKIQTEKIKSLKKLSSMPLIIRSKSKYLDTFSTTTQELLETIFKETIKKRKKKFEPRKSRSDNIENALKTTEFSRLSSKEKFRNEPSSANINSESSKTSDFRNKSNYKEYRRQNTGFDSLNDNFTRRKTAKSLDNEIKRITSRKSAIFPILSKPKIKRQSVMRVHKNRTIASKKSELDLDSYKASMFIENTAKLVIFLIIKLKENSKSKFTRENTNQTTVVSENSLNLCVTMARFITGTLKFYIFNNETIEQEEKDDVKHILNGFFFNNKVKANIIKVNWPERQKDSEKITEENWTIKDIPDKEMKNRLNLKLKFLHESKSVGALHRTGKMQVKNLDDSFDIPKKPKRVKNINADFIRERIKKLSKERLKNHYLIRSSSNNYRYNHT
jgi:hypothetical protein